MALLSFIILQRPPSGLAQTVILHSPPEAFYTDKAGTVTVRIDAESQARLIEVYYQQPGEEAFQQVQMRPSRDGWKTEIPSRALSGTQICYFISAFLSDQRVVTFPEYNPYNQPICVPVRPAREDKPDSDPVPTAVTVPDTVSPSPPPTTPASSESELLILSPEEGDRLAPRDVLFAASWSHLDSSTIQVTLDQRDITSRSERSTYMLTYTPKHPLSEGTHTIRVSGQDRQGNSLENEVRFQVRSQPTLDRTDPETPSRFSAHLFSDVRHETISEQDETLVLGGGSFRGRRGSLRYDGRVFLTSLEGYNGQPASRFHFSAGTDYIGVTGGDAYPRYNDLILWGKRVRGISGYIHLGWVNIDVVYGQTRRAVEADPASSISTLSSNGTFARTLFAVRPSFGSGDHFQLGFSFVKVKDDTGSIEIGSFPKDNVVLGPDLRWIFDRGRLVFKASAAISMITQNIYSGAISEDDIKDIFGKDTSIPVNPADFEQWLIINQSTTPIDPTKGTSTAYHAGVQLRYFRNHLRVGYRSVGSQYTSLANNWIRTDIQGLYFSDRIRLLQNKLFLTLGYENLQDNFQQQDANPAIDLKTFNYAISYFPGSNLPYLNASLRTHYRDNGITTLQVDSLFNNAPVTTDARSRQLHRDLSVQVGYRFPALGANHTLQLSYINSEMTDDYGDTRLPGTLPQEFSSNIRMLSWSAQMINSLRTQLSFASNSNVAGAGSNFDYSMLGLSAEYGLFDEKLLTFLEYRATRTTSETGTESSYDTSRDLFRGGGIYRLSPGHTVTLDVNFYSIRSESGTGEFSSTDSILRLRYEQYF
jgi:hypothetical protein